MELSRLLIDLKKSIHELLSSYCVVNGELMPFEEIYNMGYNEFSIRFKNNMPMKLYRYYPNKELNVGGKTINYSHQALLNNTVFLQTPTEFDDVYDSEISIDYQEYEHIRLIEYCNRCGINVDKKLNSQEIGNILAKKLWEYFIKNKTLNGIFIKEPSNEIEKLANQIFVSNVTIELCSTDDFGLALSKAINKEYIDYVNELKSIFRIACFTTTPYSQLMWATYADYHKGFCLEYTVQPNENLYKEIFLNLFPVIYCKIRPNITAKLVESKDNEITESWMWDIYYHGVLRKSIDWAFQNEWRLLRPKNRENDGGYNIKFFPITKVYLGNRMSVDKRREIIDICNKKNIPYTGMKRNPAVFEMEECSIRCEDCSSYNNSSI